MDTGLDRDGPPSNCLQPRADALCARLHSQHGVRTNIRRRLSAISPPQQEISKPGDRPRIRESPPLAGLSAPNKDVLSRGSSADWVVLSEW
jgi:hypothetical protein